jgi:PAS domain S-box-containing protein
MLGDKSMTENLDKQQKKEVMKDIIRQLHKGLSVRDAKERFEKEIGNISSTEIAEIEQSLIEEGLSPEEIKKFCNVHALLFKSALEQAVSEETSPAHPVHLFRQENREIEKLTASLKELMERKGDPELAKFKENLRDMLLQLKSVEIHYERKEQLLFPYLEKKGFFGPPKVMWGKDNEIRDLFRKAFSEIESVEKKEDLEALDEKTINPLLEEIEGMIFKEENILFPTSLEKLSPDDWVEILKESDEVGYAFIEKPKETQDLMGELKDALAENPSHQDDEITLATGKFALKELTAVLNTMPVDITFVDKDDRVRYFSEGKERIFTRTKAVLGRRVQDCHPPQSVAVVEKIVNSFREGKRDSADFWINLEGRKIYIRYFAVRDKQGGYLGTLEVTQDVTEIKKLEGEKRLLDERD